MVQIVDRVMKSNSSVDANIFPIERITALWALSEAALGGVLHAFRFPMTGLVINSTSVIFIVLIAHYARHKGTILRATFIVLIIKGMVSPHTPINAFIAVTIQGVLGELLFRSKKYFTFSALVLGIITLLLSGSQKIIVLTVVFGNNLWESIDIFGNFIIQKFHLYGPSTDGYDISFWIILGYLSLHVLVGIFVGIVSSRIPGWINREQDHYENLFQLEKVQTPFQIKAVKKRKSWIKRPSGSAVFLLAIMIVILSYFYPEITSKQGVKAIIMVLRSIVIMALWYLWIGPKLLLLLNRILRKKHNQYFTHVQNTLKILPPLRSIIYQTWNSSRQYKRIRRIKTFILMTLVGSLSTEFRIHETD
jgi:hypothetical protein